MSKMNPEVKALWVTALRSGEYEQGKGLLHEESPGIHRYCCLGVLCDLAVAEGKVTTAQGWLNYDLDGAVRTVSYDYGSNRDNGVLPSEVMEWAGLNNSVGLLDEHIDYHQSLVSLNDAAGYTFNRIADVIEEQF